MNHKVGLIARIPESWGHSGAMSPHRIGPDKEHSPPAKNSHNIINTTKSSAKTATAHIPPTNHIRSFAKRFSSGPDAHNHSANNARYHPTYQQPSDKTNSDVKSGLMANLLESAQECVDYSRTVRKNTLITPATYWETRSEWTTRLFLAAR